MADNLFIAEVLNGIANGFVTGMKLRQDKERYTSESELEKEKLRVQQEQFDKEMDLNERELLSKYGEKKTKEFAYSEWKTMTPEERTSYSEYVKAAKGKDSSFNDVLMYMAASPEDRKSMAEAWALKKGKPELSLEEKELGGMERRVKIQKGIRETRKIGAEAEKIEAEAKMIGKPKALSQEEKDKLASETLKNKAYAEYLKNKAKSDPGSKPLSPSVAKEVIGIITQLEQSQRATEKVKQWMQTLKKDGAQKSNFVNKLKYFTKNYFGIVNDEEALGATAFYGELNAYIKQLTGAQMSEPEARRLLKAMPQLQQKPDTFMAIWNDIMRDRYMNAKSTIEGYNKSYAGYGGMNDFVRDVGKKGDYFNNLSGLKRENKFTKDNIEAAKKIASNPGHPKYKSAINYLKEAGVIK